jgi:hypothetical protein
MKDEGGRMKTGTKGQSDEGAKRRRHGGKSGKASKRGPIVGAGDVRYLAVAHQRWWRQVIDLPYFGRPRTLRFALHLGSEVLPYAVAVTGVRNPARSEGWGTTQNKDEG